MASAEFSPELCEQLYALPKQVASRINWKRGPGEDVFLFQSKSSGSRRNRLRSNGPLEKERTTWPHVLGIFIDVYRPLHRGFDMAIYHRNPGGLAR